MVFSNNLLMGAAGQATGYEIDQSIRFNDDDSAHLSRTPGSAGNRKTWTFSAWVKRANLTGGRQAIFSANNNAYLQLGPDAASREMITILNEGSGTDLNWYTTQVFRDPGAWFHVVWQFDTTQAAADNRTKLYINGSQVTAFTKGATPDQDFEGAINNNVEHKIGEASHAATFYLDAYLAEIHFIDGTAKAASDFGETNDDGVWIPKGYSGAYGTQGFYLKGQDSSALGDDTSGNGNDFASSGLAAADQITDSPTDNHCTLNPLDGAGTLSNGNLVNAATGSGFVSRRATIGIPSSGKWAFRVKKSANNFMVGVMAPQATDGDPDTNGVDAVFYYDEDGTSSGDIQTRRSGSKVVETTDPPAGIAADTFMEVLIDKDNNRLGVVIGGTAYVAVDSGVAIQNTMTQIFVATAGSGVTATVDFGQSGFTPSQTGYKALNTANLATPTITDGSAYFQATTYTGDGGGAHEINQTGNSTFEPSLVWIKSRSAATNNVLQDQVRGNFIIYSDLANAQGATGGGWVGSFDSDGFTVNVNGPINASGETFVGWQWKANGSGSSNTDGSITSSVSADTASGFSIATYTGTGSNATVGHGLGAVPKMIIIKDTTNAESWIVYNEAVGNDGNVYLNLTNGKATQAIFQDTTPTSSVFSLGTIDGANKASAGHVAYCFVEIDGYSSISSYTGNGSTDGPFVYTGFKPAFVMTKCTSGASDWKMWDNERGPYNVNGVTLAANSGGAESTGTAQESDFLSNGFKIRGSDTETNGSGSTYIYMAFAENPFGGDGVAPATAR
jgi:hypothetical protein